MAQNKEYFPKTNAIPNILAYSPFKRKEYEVNDIMMNKWVVNLVGYT